MQILSYFNHDTRACLIIRCLQKAVDTRLAPEDMVSTIFIFSDMEFDEANPKAGNTSSGPYMSHFCLSDSDMSEPGLSDSEPSSPFLADLYQKYPFLRDSAKIRAKERARKEEPTTFESVKASTSRCASAP